MQKRQRTAALLCVIALGRICLPGQAIAEDPLAAAGWEARHTEGATAQLVRNSIQMNCAAGRMTYANLLKSIPDGDVLVQAQIVLAEPTVGKGELFRIGFLLTPPTAVGTQAYGLVRQINGPNDTVETWKLVDGRQSGQGKRGLPPTGKVSWFRIVRKGGTLTLSTGSANGSQWQEVGRWASTEKLSLWLSACNMATDRSAQVSPRSVLFTQVSIQPLGASSPGLAPPPVMPPPPLTPTPHVEGPKAPATHSDLPERPKPAGPPLEVFGAGFSVQQLTDVLAKQYGHAGRKGVLVVSVDPRGAAAQSTAPLRLWDLITHVATTPVTSRGEFSAAIAREDASRGLMLRVVGADGRNRFAVVRITR